MGDAPFKLPEGEPYYGIAEPPETDDLPLIEAAAKGCQACHLWRFGTQTVFGAGPVGARLMFIGEQPGDREDKEGKPFVGPAGRILDEALEAAEIDRSDVFLTNAVKHFKWTPKGARRLHQKPNRGEIRACNPWLEAEIASVKPQLLVCLGATAAQAIFGFDFKLMANRGKLLEVRGRPALATIHPSAVLRQRSSEAREEAMRSLVEDLKVANRSVSRRPYLA